MILLLTGVKGGTGKSTVATSLAALRASEGRDVLLVDSDKQQSASDWAAIRREAIEAGANAEKVPCVQIYGKRLVEEVRDIAERYEDVIIDAGGRDSVELRAALTIADQAVIPVQASQFDTWALEQMAELVEQARAFNPDLPATVLLNRVSTNISVTEATEAKELIEDLEALTRCQSVLYERIAWRKAASEGLNVMERQSRDGKACAELRRLYEEVFK